MLLAPQASLDDRVLDRYDAALAIASRELAGARQWNPGLKVRLVSEDHAFAKTELAYLRERLKLPLKEPGPTPGALTLDFRTARRLPGGRIAMDAGVGYRPRGGFMAHYVVQPNVGPLGTVVRRTVFIEF